MSNPIPQPSPWTPVINSISEGASWAFDHEQRAKYDSETQAKVWIGKTVELASVLGGAASVYGVALGLFSCLISPVAGLATVLTSVFGGVLSRDCFIASRTIQERAMNTGLLNSIVHSTRSEPVLHSLLSGGTKLFREDDFKASIENTLLLKPLLSAAKQHLEKA